MNEHDLFQAQLDKENEDALERWRSFHRLQREDERIKHITGIAFGITVVLCIGAAFVLYYLGF